jgi:hypothetical protein
MPSLACAAASAHRADSRCARMGVERPAWPASLPSCCCTCRKLASGPTHDPLLACWSSSSSLPFLLDSYTWGPVALRLPRSVDLSSTFYALNPGGDLEATQATFQTWFAGMRGWEVRRGCGLPAAGQCICGAHGPRSQRIQGR